MKITTAELKKHKIVDQKQWLTARKKLLLKEKKFSKLRDQLAQQRRQLPWVRIDQEYIFHGPTGKITLAEMFAGKSQILIYHFMFGPGWGEGCEHCSFWADHFDSLQYHLSPRDTTFAVVSRARLKEIKPFKKRMGWKFNWYSSHGSDFNYDLNVSFTPEQNKNHTAIYNYAPHRLDVGEREGISAFYRDPRGHIFHTYSAYERGIDLLNTTYNFLDLTAKGRNENPAASQDWVRYHDEY